MILSAGPQVAAFDTTVGPVTVTVDCPLPGS